MKYALYDSKVIVFEAIDYVIPGDKEETVNIMFRGGTYVTVPGTVETIMMTLRESYNVV